MPHLSSLLHKHHLSKSKNSQAELRQECQSKGERQVAYTLDLVSPRSWLHQCCNLAHKWARTYVGEHIEKEIMGCPADCVEGPESHHVTQRSRRGIQATSLLTVLRTNVTLTFHCYYISGNSGLPVFNVSSYAHAPYSPFHFLPCTIMTWLHAY